MENLVLNLCLDLHFHARLWKRKNMPGGYNNVTRKHWSICQKFHCKSGAVQNGCRTRSNLLDLEFLFRIQVSLSILELSPTETKVRWNCWNVFFTMSHESSATIIKHTRIWMTTKLSIVSEIHCVL